VALQKFHGEGELALGFLLEWFVTREWMNVYMSCEIVPWTIHLQLHSKRCDQHISFLK
jgi:hypothetical protein